MAAADVLLVAFRWPDGDAAVRAAFAALGESAATAPYRAIDGDAGRAWLDLADVDAGDVHAALSPALRELKLVRLVRTQHLSGASAGADAPLRYVVATDVEAAHEADFNAWYEQEHLAGLAAVPGTVRATRLVDPAGSPRYHACYDLATLATFDSPAWLAARGTAWSSRVRPTFRNTSRTMYRRVGA
jgi:hypothetical protein